MELKELLISALAITFIFVYPYLRSPDWWVAFLLYFFFIGLGFAIHESAHKFMAKARGAWSEFRMWRQGLLFALLMRVVGGPLFIAPGATYWAKRNATPEDQGLVAVVGPISNIVLAGIFFLSSLVIPILAIGTYVNLQLAMFNLLPIPPLDGSKVIKWNPIIWGVLFFTSLLLPKVL
ncbi:MAG: site-2 protease family protein [Candidatus Altiarchaeota archaeon]|nr:site-2 protease family protein [Candidatus Altiarchaeota archaeon]